MNMDYFMKRYTCVLMNEKDDHTFETLKIITGGTTSPRIAKLLNFAVSQMDKDETYVEVGVFAGTTLISAAHVNRKRCIGIDNYDMEYMKGMGCDPKTVRDRCVYNINVTNCGAQLIEKDFRNVTKEDICYPIAVSFIDGTHNFESVMENLKWLEPMLADEAVIVFDDVNYLDVSRAIFSWLHQNPEHWDMLSYVKPFFYNDKNTHSVQDRFLNNGVAILHYHKDPMAEGFIVGTN